MNIEIPNELGICMTRRDGDNLFRLTIENQWHKCVEKVDGANSVDSKVFDQVLLKSF